MLGLSFLLMFYSHTLRSLARTHNDGATGVNEFLILKGNANAKEKGSQRLFSLRVTSLLAAFVVLKKANDIHTCLYADKNASTAF